MKNIILVIGALIFFTGCTNYSTELLDVSSQSESVKPYSNVQPKCMAIMDEFSVKSDGQTANISVDFKERFISEIKKTNIFERVLDENPLNSSEKITVFSLDVSENQDTHQGSNVTKGFFVGLTLWLITPFVYLDYDFDSEMLLNATNPEGKTRVYKSKSSSSASYQLYANSQAAGNEARAKALSANINSLMNQIIDDASFLCSP